MFYQKEKTMVKEEKEGESGKVCEIITKEGFFVDKRSAVFFLCSKVKKMYFYEK